MSEAVQVYTITEGPTDVVVIKAVLEFLGKRYTLTTLQPEGDGIDGPVQSDVGYGWRDGVRAYCLDESEVIESCLQRGVLVVQVDADVARKNAGDFNRDLVRPCPPARDTCNQVRTEILAWLGMATPPTNLVLCVPAQSIEAWVVAALGPDSMRGPWRSHLSRATLREKAKLKALGIGAWLECRPNPEGQLKTVGLEKSPPAFDDARVRIVRGWLSAQRLPEASRFEGELSAALLSVDFAPVWPTAESCPQASPIGWFITVFG